MTHAQIKLYVRLLLQGFLHLSKWYTALGFPGGKEALEAGAANLGLYDRTFKISLTFWGSASNRAERLALRWVQNYIFVFGGDPTKVTM
jgi:hypothetical protein